MKTPSKRLEYLEKVTEEIKMSTNLDAKIENEKIVVHHIFGRLEYEVVFNNVAREFYRFCHSFGLKMCRYGLSQMEEEHYNKHYK